MTFNSYSRAINCERIYINKSERTTEFKEYHNGNTNTYRTTELIREKFMRMSEVVTDRLETRAYVAPSQAAWQDLVVVEVPSRGREATVRTIKEFGHRHSTANITDLFYVTTSGINLRDYEYHHVTKILGLRSCVKMHHHRSLSSGSTVLFYAKQFAEKNCQARVLVISSEISAVVNFHGLSHTRAHETRARREDATALYIEDLQRRNRDDAARVRKVQGENDRLRADKYALEKRLERSYNARLSHRRSSASTQGPRRELFLSLSY